MLDGVNFGLRTVGGLACLLAAGCLMPSPRKIEAMNGKDRALVLDHATQQLDCPNNQLRLREALQNSMGRVGMWTVEGCSQQTSYRVIEGVVVEQASASDE